MTSREMFEAAIEGVLAQEGGDADDPHDRGGRTRFGIAQRWHPDLDVSTLTRPQAIEVYWERYWQGRGYDRLPLALACKTFDLAVNMGHGAATKCLQRALRACGHAVAVDGQLGDETAAAAQASPPDALLAAIRSEAAGAYRLIVCRDPSQAAFARGWENRAYS